MVVLLSANCPNCFPAMGLSSGWILALFICALFFLAAVAAMAVASKTGYLDNLEDTKFSMLED